MSQQPDSTPPHGDRRRYQGHRCRCQKCTEANTIYQREYRASRSVIVGPDGPMVMRQPRLPGV